MRIEKSVLTWQLGSQCRLKAGVPWVMFQVLILIKRINTNNNNTQKSISQHKVWFLLFASFLTRPKDIPVNNIDIFFAASLKFIV